MPLLKSPRKKTLMNEKSKPHYAPWERTEQEDLQIQNALDKASPAQMAGFIDALLEEADKQEETRQKQEE
jgi:hypothetical protein